jgi:FkbM family methyltransferase
LIDFRSLILIYEIYLLECYECLGAFRILQGYDVIDVGSNIGLFSVKAAREVGPEGKVISIEPHPVAFELLRHNIQVNGLKNVTPIPVALGSRQDEAPLLFSRGSTVGTFYDSILHSQDNARTVVRIVTLDSLVAELKLERVDFLKIDVEGAEMDVLEGAAGLLERGMVQRVVVETHGDELVSRSIDFLTSRGFDAVALDVFPSFFVGHPFPTVFALRAERPIERKPTSYGLVDEKLINPSL